MTAEVKRERWISGMIKVVSAVDTWYNDKSKYKQMALKIIEREYRNFIPVEKAYFGEKK